jgi:hypothetical protein
MPVAVTQSRYVLAALSAALGLVWFVVYLFTVSPTVNFIDSGELTTALYEPGVAHPPGYPLYTLLGYVVSHVLPGEVAWRVNLISAISAAVAVGLLFLLVCRAQQYIVWTASRKRAVHVADRRAKKTSQPVERRPAQAEPTQLPALDWTSILCAAGAASLLGASATFWSRAVQAKMYTLHYLLVVAILLLALGARWAYERGDLKAARRLLTATVFALGLSLTNHLITTLLFPGVFLFLAWGSDWTERLRWGLKLWTRLVPAFIAPLLLYLYLPLRASQGPVMNWGSTNSLPDFWRHVTGWQYSVYLGEDLGVTLGRFWNFLASQWGLLTWPVVLLALVAGALLARANMALFAATAAISIATIVFSLKYGSSEMVPYIVPFYIMLVLWLGLAPASARVAGERLTEGSLFGDMSRKRAVAPIVAALLVILSAGSALIEYPLQDHSRDHLAELFATNIYNTLEPNSIIVTDHWDFASPSYYLQVVKGVRPDIVIVDRLLAKYPWYLDQLEKRYPWLIANSKDAVDAFRTEQYKWINGQSYSQSIGQLYINMLSSFVERNIGTHPAYVFFSTPCPQGAAPENCENNQIAAGFARQPAGVGFRLLPGQPTSAQLPPVPNFDLRGFTYDKTPLDDFARINAGLYIDGYRNTAQVYAQAGKNDVAADLLAKAQQLEAEISSR